jgi:hypothetical protein
LHVDLFLDVVLGDLRRSSGQILIDVRLLLSLCFVTVHPNRYLDILLSSYLIFRPSTNHDHGRPLNHLYLPTFYQSGQELMSRDETSSPLQLPHLPIDSWQTVQRRYCAVLCLEIRVQPQAIPANRDPTSSSFSPFNASQIDAGCGTRRSRRVFGRAITYHTHMIVSLVSSTSWQGLAKG